MSLTAAATGVELLDELFRCDKFQHLFPGTSMPVCACLRRQLERIPSKDQRGRLKALAEWPAPHAFCAFECLVGRQHLELARRTHVPAETCLQCGAAQVGDGSANPCAGCPPDEKRVPRGALRPSSHPVSSRIWGEEAPEAPIGLPNPMQVASAEAAKRLEAFRAARAAEEQHHQDVPAAPAEEEGMPRGQLTTTRTCCDSKGGRHRADCTGKPKEPAKGEVRAPQRRAARVTSAAKFCDPTTLDVNQLVSTIQACRDELARRKSELQGQLDACNAALEE